jgi:hypothetical protein
MLITHTVSGLKCDMQCSVICQYSVFYVLNKTYFKCYVITSIKGISFNI